MRQGLFDPGLNTHGNCEGTFDTPRRILHSAGLGYERHRLSGLSTSDITIRQYLAFPSFILTLPHFFFMRSEIIQFIKSVKAIRFHLKPSYA
jgi:hypothetical protein